ncbi:MAG: cysteine desulfurase NifS [Christensenellales bacterium]|jgi:cysteine desulfurase
MPEERLYLDHAATTPLDPEVLQAMMPYLTENYGNASSVYSEGRTARAGIEKAREQVRKALGAKDAKEILFTSGGTEADNWAIKGYCLANRKKGNHIITTNTEHHAVLHTCEFMEKQGYTVTYLPVDSEGRVFPEQVAEAITPETVLVSVMYANNEIGSVNPIGEIGRVCRGRGVAFHTDAVQAAGALAINVEELCVDLLSLSAHKFYGPKGVGALYCRKGVRLENLAHGGAQERGHRGGTYNTAGIVGLGAALEKAIEHLEENSARITGLRDQLLSCIEKIPHTRINGSRTHRLPNNVNACFQFIEGESLLLNLDLAGISASSGSACTSGSLDPSHVLLAIGLSHEIAHGSLRLTLGKSTAPADIDRLMALLPGIIEKLRSMSPLYADYTQSQPEV